MELLATNQPWNLLLFMVIPVVLAETVAITELYLLYYGSVVGKVRTVSRIAGVVGGAYFIGVFCYLVWTAVLPITLSGEWRGVGDIIAVFSYLSGVVPLVAIALLDAGWKRDTLDDRRRLGWHAFWVGVFLVVAHIGMIFGMLNPTVLGYTPDVDRALSM